MKSEPEEYSIDDLVQEGIGEWTGIRNYQVRNLIRDVLKPGDLALFYHSSTKNIGCVGLMEVVGEPYPDPTQFNTKSPYYDPKATTVNPRWLAFKVKFRERFPKLVSLTTMRATPALASMRIMERGSRLSITPVTTHEFTTVSKLAGTETKN